MYNLEIVYKSLHMKSKHILLSAILVLFFAQYSYADTYPRNYSIDILHYAFDLQFSDNTDEMLGKASITIQFKKSDVKQVRLDLINASEKWKGKGMSVQSVTYNNQSVSYTHRNDALLIELPTAPAMDQVMILVIQYKGIPAGGMKIQPTKFGDRSFMCENWPNNARHWLPTVDHPYDKATSEFIVTAPAHYKVISNGLLQEESLIDRETKRTHWKQSVPVSCWLFVLGIADFAVQYVDQFDHKSIETWVYPKDREAGFRDFAEPTKQVLQFYSDYVGPFAYEKLASVETQSVGGGMETSSAIFYDEKMVTGKYTTRLRNVVIHEIAHQWFGNAVTETTWDDAWLSEGFATFFTLLFIENAYGHDEFLSGIKAARKTVYDLSKKDSTWSIVANRSAETGAVTSGLTYQKGAWTLHMLREKIGHDNFRKGIQAYYKKYYNANTNTANFIAEMEKVSGQNLQSFFTQYLTRPDNLKLSGSWSYDEAGKQIIIKLQQTQSSGKPFDFPIEVGVYKSGSSAAEIQKFTMSDLQAEFKIPSAVKADLIVLDPRVVLLGEIEFR
jgi:aminopeptidase N